MQELTIIKIGRINIWLATEEHYKSIDYVTGNYHFDRQNITKIHTKRDELSFLIVFAFPKALKDEN